MKRKYYRLRKLTPKEVGRLMDVDDASIEEMMSCGLKDNALYKMYGNSIVVACMEHMFDNLFLHRPEPKTENRIW